MKIKKAIFRSQAYIKRFYSIASIPIQFIAYTSIIYDRVIIEVPMFYSLFPRYRMFLGTSFVFIIAFIYCGYLYTKKTRFPIEEIEINIEVNPYANYKVTKVQLPFYRAIIEFFESQNIDVEDLKEILRNSE